MIELVKMTEEDDVHGRETIHLTHLDYDGLGSTQDYVRRVIEESLLAPFTTHLEIETYTWDVLPGPLKIDLLESIHREYEWVLSTCRAASRRHR